MCFSNVCIIYRYIIHIFIYFFRKACIRKEALNIWSGNNIPLFKGNEENMAKLMKLVNELEQYQYPDIGFKKQDIKNYICNMFSQRRKRHKKGEDFEKVIFVVAFS